MQLTQIIPMVISMCIIWDFIIIILYMYHFKRISTFVSQ